MLKKLALSSMALLAMTPIIASVLPQVSVSAETAMSANIKENISAHWSGYFSDTDIVPGSVFLGTTNGSTKAANIDINYGKTSKDFTWKVSVWSLRVAGSDLESTQISREVLCTIAEQAIAIPFTKSTEPGDSLVLHFQRVSGSGALSLNIS
ncbi:hypothetical protein OGZ51_06460 [Lactococcus lactis]|uniref:Uncharacterized protein n=1 Tax=Lactococcus lactis TaxID=1358 RepID=A0A9X4NGP7_9LACT|nr:hypothetical protein [Lactococcus lactis]MDG4983788.1 hypothetical protein [Lactococcus lactis]